MQNRAPIKTVCLALKTPALLYGEKLAHTFEEKKKEKKKNHSLQIWTHYQESS